MASPYHYALFHNLQDQDEPLLAELVQRLDPKVEVILVEGYRQANIPRLEVYRPSRGIEPIYTITENVLAIVSDVELDHIDLPRLDLNQPLAVAAFILDYVRKETSLI